LQLALLEHTPHVLVVIELERERPMTNARKAGEGSRDSLSRKPHDKLRIQGLV